MSTLMSTNVEFVTTLDSYVYNLKNSEGWEDYLTEDELSTSLKEYEEMGLPFTLTEYKLWEEM